MVLIALTILLLQQPSCMTLTEPTSSPNGQPAEVKERESRTDVEDSEPRGRHAFPQLKDLKQRLKQAKYPRIGQAWSSADNLHESSEETIARHDLYFSSVESYGLRWVPTARGQSSILDPTSVEEAKAKRDRLLHDNPNIVMLAEIRYHDGQSNLFPPKSPFWQHNGRRRVTNEAYPQFKMFDYTNPQFRDHVAAQARAALASGAVDGVMLDWWHDGLTNHEADEQAKLELLKNVRAAVGPDALIMINSNEYRMPKAMTKLVNGYYMESSRTGTLASDEEIKDEWKQIEDTLNYSEKHGRSPHVNMVETWWKKGSSRERGELDQMRATTTFVMTHSDGFALFADPDNNGRTQDHEHDWYSFWNANLGRPLGSGDLVDDGSWRREFQNGTVVSNALSDQPITVSFPQDRIRASDDKVIMAGQKCTVNARDGEIFLKENQAPDHEAADHEAANREAADHEAANHEAANREAENREAANREAADHEGADHEGPTGGLSGTK